MAILSDASQLAAQGDQVSHSDQVQALIEAVACEHTFMEAFDSYEVTEQVLGSLTIDEVNGVAKDMCNHLTNFGTDTDEATPPSAIIACVPLPTRVTEDELLEAITEGAAADVEPEVDVVIPPALMSASMVADALAANPPAWAAGSEAAAGEGAACARTGITSRRLGNGLAVNYKAQAFEPQRAWLRLVAPGGRLAEPTDAPGAMAIGARTMQEGGAFGPWTREQVELFCVDHLIMVEITCNEETLTLDFTFPTNQMEGSAVTGTEAVMQILNQILSQFKWEEDALDRAKASFDQQYVEDEDAAAAAAAAHTAPALPADAGAPRRHACCCCCGSYHSSAFLTHSPRPLPQVRDGRQEHGRVGHRGHHQEAARRRADAHGLHRAARRADA